SYTHLKIINSYIIFVDDVIPALRLIQFFTVLGGTFAVVFKIGMFKCNDRFFCPLLLKLYFNLACFFGIGFRNPRRTYLPQNDKLMWWIPLQNLSPVALKIIWSKFKTNSSLFGLRSEEHTSEL